MSNGIPFVSAEAVKNGRLDFERRRGNISLELHWIYCQKVKPRRDDVFVVKSGNTTGAVAIVETDEEFSVWSPLAVLRANLEKIVPRFLYYALQAPYFQRSVQLSWSQGTQPNIGMTVLGNLGIAVPSILEQRLIVEMLDGLLAKVNELRAHSQVHVTLLREYRTSLISAAVTGQLDVCSFGGSGA
ncbi:MAG: restriction endonuclease subunit S [Acidobacteriaceae bacterium]